MLKSREEGVNLHGADGEKYYQEADDEDADTNEYSKDNDTTDNVNIAYYIDKNIKDEEEEIHEEEDETGSALLITPPRLSSCIVPVAAIPSSPRPPPAPLVAASSSISVLGSPTRASPTAATTNTLSWNNNSNNRSNSQFNKGMNTNPFAATCTFDFDGPPPPPPPPPTPSLTKIQEEEGTTAPLLQPSSSSSFSSVGRRMLRLPLSPQSSSHPKQPPQQQHHRTTSSLGSLDGLLASAAKKVSNAALLFTSSPSSRFTTSGNSNSGREIAKHVQPKNIQHHDCNDKEEDLLLEQEENVFKNENQIKEGEVIANNNNHNNTQLLISPPRVFDNSNNTNNNNMKYNRSSNSNNHNKNKVIIKEEKEGEEENDENTTPELLVASMYEQIKQNDFIIAQLEEEEEQQQRHQQQQMRQELQQQQVKQQKCKEGGITIDSLKQQLTHYQDLLLQQQQQQQQQANNNDNDNAIITGKHKYKDENNNNDLILGNANVGIINNDENGDKNTNNNITNITSINNSGAPNTANTEHCIALDLRYVQKLHDQVTSSQQIIHRLQYYQLPFIKGISDTLVQQLRDELTFMEDDATQCEIQLMNQLSCSNATLTQLQLDWRKDIVNKGEILQSLHYDVEQLHSSTRSLRDVATVIETEHATMEQEGMNQLMELAERQCAMEQGYKDRLQCLYETNEKLQGRMKRMSNGYRRSGLFPPLAVVVPPQQQHQQQQKLPCKNDQYHKYSNNNSNDHNSISSGKVQQVENDPAFLKQHHIKEQISSIHGIMDLILNTNCFNTSSNFNPHTHHMAVLLSMVKDMLQLSTEQIQKINHCGPPYQGHTSTPASSRSTYFVGQSIMKVRDLIVTMVGRDEYYCDDQNEQDHNVGKYFLYQSSNTTKECVENVIINGIVSIVSP